MKITISTIAKYLFSILLIIYATVFYNSLYYSLFGIIELMIIFLISNSIVNKKRILGHIINDILMLFFNINYIVLIFGNSYVSSIMLSNLSSISALGDNLIKYGVAAILLFVISFLPVQKISIKHNVLLLISFVVSYILLFFMYSYSNSCYGSYYMLINGYINEYKMEQKINNTSVSEDLFVKDSSSSNNKHKVYDNPNIILIFTEGFSMNILEDERNIMPNTKEYLNKSLSFKNYFNHTAATYRGLIGQLFSGYQYNNNDENVLISIEDILRDNGYYTEFINVEDNNKEFTQYLNTLHFDSVNSGVKDEYIDDEKAYDYLFDEAIRLNKEDKPFFLSIYTFQTHVGMDSDNKFGDGRSNVLNRFHNNDEQFKKFMNRFESSDLFNNTIIVYTSDHASYTDADFYSTFKDYKRTCTFLDRIPFFIYHKNIEPEVIDVDGKNSLDLAPTILDYVDIKGKNYFLGESLFDEENESKYDHYASFNPGEYYSTFNSKVRVEGGNKTIEKMLINYYAISRKK